MGEPVFFWGWHAGQRQPTASCTDCAKVCTGKGGAKEMHPLEASGTWKKVSAHIKMADGAGVPGMRMVVDGARVRMDITTNKEQCQDKETPKRGPVSKKKRSHPVVTGQRAAQRKNSRDNEGNPSVEPLWRSVLPFRLIPIGEGTAPPRLGGRALVQS